MNGEQILVLTLLFFTLIFFMSNKFRYDVVAFGALLAAVIIGAVDISNAFTGFAHPATITVAIVLVMSHALAVSGVTDHIAKLINPTIFSPTLHVMVLCMICALLSAFMNNIGALALLMPVAVQTSIKAKRHPAYILMPLSFSSLLGGLVTMIGTPPNIIISMYKRDLSKNPDSDFGFSMFDFSYVGGVVALCGILFVSTIGWRLLRKPSNNKSHIEDLFDIHKYLSELVVTQKSRVIDMTIDDVEKENKDLEFTILAIIRNEKKIINPERNQTFKPGDIILLEAGPKDTELFLARCGLKFEKLQNQTNGDIKEDDMQWIEVVITPGSKLEGQTLDELDLRNKYRINVIALARQGQKHISRLRKLKLKTGDVLLVQGMSERLFEVISMLGCLPLADRKLHINRTKKTIASISLFIGAIVLSSINFLPMHISLGLALIGVVALNIIPIRELYDGIDPSIIVLIGCLIPIGMAFEDTGLTKLIAKNILGFAKGTDPRIVLFVLMVFTMLLTDILNNSATALLMAPVAKDIAMQLHVNVDTFLMSVAIASSCAFLTPIGHQNNTIIMGPGGYKFSDYWRMGLPLEIIIVCISIPALLYFWPL